MLTDNEIKRVTEDALGFKAWARTLEECMFFNNPITTGVFNNKGNLLQALGRKEEAERCFQTAKRLNSQRIY